MTDATFHQVPSSQIRSTGGAAVRVLSLAAAPTFAFMALVTALLDGGQPAGICSGAPGLASHGMVVMYVLMSAFHAAAWLKVMVRASPGTHVG